MSDLNSHRRKSKISTILIVLFITFLSYPVSANIFSPFYSKLEKDYLAEKVGSDLKYFDGEWKGVCVCPRIDNSPGFSSKRSITLKDGSGEIIIGIKGREGYRYIKAKVKQNGKVKMTGKYQSGETKYIRLGGQIGVDPENPEVEIMWLKGIRGPRKCEYKFTRPLPGKAISIASKKRPSIDRVSEKKTDVPSYTTETKKPILQPKKDTNPPRIIISSHDTTRGMKIVQNQKKVTVSGKVADESGIVEVIVNDRDAVVDNLGNFNAQILLGIGKNRVVVSALDSFGNRDAKEFIIQRESQALAVKSDAQKNRGLSGAYFALIIGNNDYAYLPKLKTARKDAQTVETVLKRKFGFNTKLLQDATRNDIVRAINSYRKIVKENDRLLIYYAGHGEFDKTAGKAYWLPVDARSDDDTNWILADRITSNIKRIPSRHILIVADSCYSGTLTRRALTRLSSTAERSRYINKMLEKKSRTLLASGGNEPVSDSGGDGHSVFAAAFLTGLTKMEKDIFSAEELFYSYIKEQVAGNADQVPEYNIIRNSGHDGGDFIFRRASI